MLSISSGAWEPSHSLAASLRKETKTRIHGDISNLCG